MLRNILFRSVVVRSSYVYSSVGHVRNQHYSVDTKVPQHPTWIAEDSSDVSKPPEISDELVKYLERTSLVQFSNEEGVKQLYEAIDFARKIRNVDTSQVEPLYSLQENMPAYLREDKVTDGNCRDEVISQAVKNVEDWYFVAPPGNVPLNQPDKPTDDKK